MTQNSPEIIVFFGMIATGKSTLAKLWAETHGMRYYNSDVIRKDLAGTAARLSSKSSFGNGIYSSDFSRKTYDQMLEKAETAIRNNRSVVLDASYSSMENRLAVIALAEKRHVPAWFIYCTCPENEMRRRMELRAQDLLSVSDGRWEIYQQQKTTFEPPAHLGKLLITIDTSSPPEQLLKKLKPLIVGRKSS